jgi:hypothetical protein
METQGKLVALPIAVSPQSTRGGAIDKTPVNIQDLLGRVPAGHFTTPRGTLLQRCMFPMAMVLACKSMNIFIPMQICKPFHKRIL